MCSRGFSFSTLSGLQLRAALNCTVHTPCIRKVRICIEKGVKLGLAAIPGRSNAQLQHKYADLPWWNVYKTVRASQPRAYARRSKIL